MLREFTYEEMTIGQRASFKKLITKGDVEKFSGITGDSNPLHLDESYASQSKFGKRVVFGFLANSLWSTIAGMHLPGKYSLILYSQSFFRNPCFEGDELTIEGIVKGKVDAGKIIVLGMSVKNQEGTVVVDGEMKVQVLK